MWTWRSWGIQWYVWYSECQLVSISYCLLVLRWQLYYKVLIIFSSSFPGNPLTTHKSSNPQGWVHGDTRIEPWLLWRSWRFLYLLEEGLLSLFPRDSMTCYQLPIETKTLQKSDVNFLSWRLRQMWTALGLLHFWRKQTVLSMKPVQSWCFGGDTRDCHLSGSWLQLWLFLFLKLSPKSTVLSWIRSWVLGSLSSRTVHSLDDVSFANSSGMA